MMVSFFYVLDVLLGFLETMMLVYGIFSLLLFFGVLNPYGRIVGNLWHMLQSMFEPILSVIRRYVPSYRGFDWSFMVLYLLIIFVRMLMREYGPLGASMAEPVVKAIAP